MAYSLFFEAHFRARFPDERACKLFLQKRRWPSTVRCPRCGHRNVYKLFRSFEWQCPSCNKSGYRFSVLVGTVFEDSRIPLLAWFTTLFAIVEASLGDGKVNVLDLHRRLGLGSYRTTWQLHKRIRMALKDKSFRKLMGLYAKRGRPYAWVIYEEYNK